MTKHAQEYINVYIAALLILSLIDAQRRFLNMLGKNEVPMYCQFVGICVHLILCNVFVSYMEMGMLGVGLASIISNLVIFVSLLIYSS